MRRKRRRRTKGKILAAAGVLTAVLTLCGIAVFMAGRYAVKSGTGAASRGRLEIRPIVESGERMEGEATVESGDTMAAEREAAMEGKPAIKREPVPLAGSTFSVMGDSISTYQGYNPQGYYAFFPENGDVAEVEDTWWYQVAENLKLQMIANGSSSGATVAGDSTGTDDPQCACNEFRTDALFGTEGACPDRMIVYLGANDMIESVPLGDNDGTRAVAEGKITNFSDAYTLMLDKLQTKYPTAEIYCCTLHPMGNYGTDTPYVAFVNGLGLTAEDYGQVIAEIAGARGLPVIDLYDCGIGVENLQEMTSDGVHPTAAGMRCIAAAVEEALSCR